MQPGFKTWLLHLSMWQQQLQPLITIQHLQRLFDIDLLIWANQFTCHECHVFIYRQMLCSKSDETRSDVATLLFSVLFATVGTSGSSQRRDSNFKNTLAVVWLAYCL